MANVKGRSTTWNFVFYLDSKLLSPDWRDDMESLHTPLAYIVHDMDDAKPHGPQRRRPGGDRAGRD